MKESVRSYVETALAAMKAHSINKHKINWDELREKVMSRASSAEEPVDTYEAIRFGLNQLNDHHSFLQLNETLATREKSRGAEYAATLDRVKEQDSTSAAVLDSGAKLDFSKRKSPSAESRVHLVGKCAVPQVVVPSRSNDEEPVLRAYAEEALAFISAADVHNTCGWIVDLRGNGGGNVAPMLAALMPLLGEGTQVSAVDGDGKFLHFWLRGRVAGVTELDGKKIEMLRLEKPIQQLRHQRGRTPRIAILIDGQTGSSGELVAIAFKGRPSTRFFGTRTAGASTSTEGFTLPDGANLVIATAVDVDRKGQRYPSGVLPDVTVLSTKGRDTELEQAIAWVSATK